ncbi:S1 family peptidase [Sphingobacterium yanglingense]|uniref:Trypsin-like peptidase n=1 Tax=Sphingobacterium yanglingense TaxID=1437280 RepID=A0A4R6WAE8_9SPHI|nr:serine protease [Sphingobacterium yanglingense]TDQ76308.1 trypsin-like peptidase [Sphingobacterium yanglingense]
MKKTKLALSLLAVGLLLGTVEVNAQTSKKWEGFSDQQEITNNFELKTEELLKSSKYITTEQAAKELLAVEGKKVKMPLVQPRKKVLDAAEIAALIQPSFVSFASAYDCGNCHRTHLNTASGYIISEDGLIATNHHVIEGYIDSKNGKNLAMSIQTSNGDVYLVEEIVSCFKDADLAIVRVDTKGKKLTPLPLGNTAKVGENVFVMSNPAPMINYFSTGKVARNYIESASKSERLPQTDITADYAAGSSGAPIVDQYGNLISTVSSTRSIYYDMREQKNLQMVVKNTKPVVLLKELILN